MSIGKDAAPVEWYIHNLAYFAVRAVGADQILAGERTLLTALNIFGEDGDAFLLLLDIDDLEPVRDLRAGSFGAMPQDWLETWLGDEQAAAWAYGVNSLVEARNECGDLLSGERFHRNYRTLRGEFLLRLRPYFGFDPA